MSTKNLARTVIEGGRTGWNVWERRHSNAQHRARQRAALASLGEDGDYGGGPRKPVRRAFDDKLGPSERWLERQVGRPWDRVRSELFQRFDSRTTAGRHILFDHLLRSVQPGGVIPRWCSFDFHIDRFGILRRLPRRPRVVFWRHPPLPRPEADLKRWLNGRRIGAHGDVLFWHTLTPTGAFRQAHRLSEDDAALWRALPAWFRDRNDPSAPLAEAAHTRN
jgi:hypothetical protein